MTIDAQIEELRRELLACDDAAELRQIGAELEAALTYRDGLDKDFADTVDGGN